MSDKLCHCNDPQVATGSNHSDQASTDYFEPLTGVEVHLCPVLPSVDPNNVVLDHSKCACHAPLVPVASDNVPMAKEAVLRMSPEEAHA